MSAATFSVSTRLNQDQAAALENLAEQQSLTVAEVIRGLILREIGQAGPVKANPVLAECVGIRLLLVNLLRPACLDSIAPFSEQEWARMLDEIKRVKHEIAMEIQTGNAAKGEGK